ncbi:MAG: hypothetical protein R3252_00065 [Robiginitalea sp.]|nr:hypothetical protein [Robiginitalea sp.]
MKNLYVQLLLALMTTCAVAQESIKGTIPDWSGGPGEVAVMAMGPPQVLGTFDDMGNLEIPLKPDMLAEVKKEVEAANAESTDGWKASLNTLADRFSCSGGALEVVNGDQPISGFPSMGAFMLVNMEEKKRFGYLMVGSSKDFADGMMPYKFKPGYFLEWYFVEEAGSVKGQCSMESYAVNQEDLYTKTTTYDLDLKKGWNIVKYEIHEVYTDGEGNSYPMNDSYSTIASMPEGVRFIFMED